MILVTGATGHLGKSVVEFLLKTTPANEIAALARDKNKAKDLADKGVTVRTGDYTDEASMVAALTGIEKLVLVSSSDLHDRAGQHINAINAAKKAGVKHIYYTSVDMKDLNNSAVGMIAESHSATIKHLEKAGITYTIFANTLYSDGLPMFFGEKVLETGVFFPAGDGKAPYASRVDMAEAIANTVAGTGHENKTYVISNVVEYSIHDAADIISKVSGKKVPYINPTDEVYKSALSAASVPPIFIDLLAGFAKAIREHEFETGMSDLEKLLGRKPETLEAFLKKVYA